MSATCRACGQSMPEGEQMFNYHGFSGPCPQVLVPLRRWPLILARVLGWSSAHAG